MRYALGVVLFVLGMQLVGPVGATEPNFSDPAILETVGALRTAPEVEHWHQGEVLFLGEWRPVDEVAEIVSNDARWKEYRQRAARMNQTEAENAELARWCESQGLANEAEWHWINVLKADPDSSEALGKLGLKRVDGQLLTKAQLAERETTQKRLEEAEQQYGPQFKRLVRQATRGGEASRTAALDEIAAVDDLYALPVLMDEILYATAEESWADAKGQRSARQAQIVKLQQAAVKAISSMPQQEATLRLLEIAVDAPAEPVRAAAASALRYRRPTTYLPLLMANLSLPLEATVDLKTLPNGRVLLREEVYEEGPLQASQRAISSKFYTQVGMRDRSPQAEQNRRNPVTDNLTPGVYVSTNPAGDRRRAMTKANQTLASIEQENARRANRNAHIAEVLYYSTGLEYGDDPQAWWDSWRDYNELEKPRKYPLVEKSYVQQEYGVVSPPPPPAPMHECFVAGTPVWTQAGMRPIEQLAVGDFVLSQDTATGRLDYRAVTATTVRPFATSVEMRIGDETIVATRGHRFWVADQGWRMAKFLEPGMPLFALGGSVRLESSEVHAEIEAFNLVVDGYHTYFVGESRLLVHDSNCPAPTNQLLPGIESYRRQQSAEPIEWALLR